MKRRIILVCLLLITHSAPSMAWSLFGPKDFEDCRAAAAKDARSNQSLAILIEKCRTDFPARRKLGGGYIYYDPISETSVDVSSPKLSRSDLEKIERAQKQKQEASYRAYQQQQAIAARKERLGRQALPAVKVISWTNKCESSYYCGSKIITVTIKNDSPYELSRVEFGWLIEANIKCSRTGSLPARGEFNGSLLPGQTTTWTQKISGLSSFDGAGPDGVLDGCLGVNQVWVK